MSGEHGDDRYDEIRDAAALYAVDALEPAERAVFEEHLRDCASCRREVAGYAEVGAHLAAGVVRTPPPSLREDVLAGIRGTAPLPASPGTREAHEGAEVVPLDVRRRRPARWLPAAAAAVLVGAAALGGWVLGVQSEQRQQEQLTAGEQAREQQEQARENRLLSAPDVVTRRIEVDGRPAALLVSQERGEALFVSAGLPDPGEDREYQLWLMRDGVPAPDARFAGGEVRTWLEGDVGDAAAVALTVEPAGGSRAPTPPVLAVAQL